jgi:hypothetical protein
MNDISGITRLAPVAHGVQASDSGTVKAFDEFKSFIESPGALSYKLADLERDGFFAIPMSGQTRSFFQSSCQDARLRAPTGHTGKGDIHWQIKIGDDRAGALDRFAQKVVTSSLKCELGAHSEIRLGKQEMELRAVGPESASTTWHLDFAPKVLACVALVGGKGTTQFLLPKVAQEKFAYQPSGLRHLILQPKVGSEIQTAEIHNAPENAFIFFLADGLRGKTDFPILVHRTPPGAEQRTNFLARWTMGEIAAATAAAAKESVQAAGKGGTLIGPAITTGS